MGAWAKLTVLAGLCLLSLPAFASACPFGNSATEIRNDGVSLEYLSIGQIMVSEPFALEICVTRNGMAEPGAELAVEAVMPAHGHGMNYAPEVIELAPGHFAAEGMLFHMPGEWEIRFRYRSGGEAVVLTGTVELK